MKWPQHQKVNLTPPFIVQLYSSIKVPLVTERVVSEILGVVDVDPLIEDLDVVVEALFRAQVELERSST